MDSNTISVLIVDDHDLVRTCYRHWLESASDITVVGVAASGEEAIDAAAELAPDIILMDLSMPGMGGLEACRRLKLAGCRSRIIALSIHEAGMVSLKLLKMGVHGFVSKSADSDQLMHAIYRVSQGYKYFPPNETQAIYDSLSPDSGNSPFRSLSQREMEVARMIFEAKTIPEIAGSLAINSKTVNTYRYRIHEKLNVRNDMEVILLAMQHQLIDQAPQGEHFTASQSR